jgi:flagellar hook assembly protein FlgD
MASITIYDAEGREIRRLVKNQLLATKGFFQWDGLNERGQKAAIGYYVLLIELFKIGRPVKVYKETVALGARF